MVIIVLGFDPIKRKMMLSSKKDLFHLPTPLDKLAFFRSLLEAEEMHTDLALALLKSIHKELGAKRTQERRAYKRYAEAVASLNHHKADVFKQVVDAWNAAQSGIPAEWFSNAALDD